jgi:acyl dehydratase
MIYFEDIVIGERVALGHHLFTAESIKAFARAYDPQGFHLDEALAAQSHFGALCASGWQTGGVWMRLMVDHAKTEAQKAIAEGRKPATLGPSPGFRDLKWLKPVYAGDTIAYSSTVIDKRESASKPRWGLVTHHNEGVNQKGERVFEFTGAVFWERRPR